MERDGNHASGNRVMPGLGVKKSRENLNGLGFRDALLSQKTLAQTLRVRYLMLRCAINVVYIIVEVRRPLAFQP